MPPSHPIRRLARLSNRCSTGRPAGRVEQSLLRTAASRPPHGVGMFTSTLTPDSPPTTTRRTAGHRGRPRDRRRPRDRAHARPCPGRDRQGRRPGRPVRRRARRNGRAGPPRRWHRRRRAGRRHRRSRARRRRRQPGGPARAGRPPRQQRRRRRPHRAAVGGRPRRLVGHHGRQPPGRRPHVAAGAPRHGGPPPRADHQRHQPGRRLPVAARLGLLGVQGGGRQADREPRPRGPAATGSACSASTPGSCPSA